ncbi:MAG: lysophospholipid acyltransferase family protein [bacterium]
MEGRLQREGGNGRAQNPRVQTTAINGHNKSRTHRNADAKRENWPGEGDSRTTVRRYGPTIDRDQERRRPLGLGRELKEMERIMQGRFSSGTETGGLLSRLKNVLTGGALWDEVRRVQLRHRSEVVDEFGFDPKVADRLGPLLSWLYESYFRVELRGLNNVPSSGRALLVANHSGTLPMDAAMLMVGVQRDHEAHRMVRPLVEDFVYHSPVLGAVIRRIGGVRANFDNAERLLERGRVAAVFPEGIQGVGKPFRDRYQLQRFGRGGFVKLALKTRSPIIPVSIVGAEEAYPLLWKVKWLSRSTGIPFLPVTPTFPLLGPLGLVPLPSKWIINVGGPIYIHESFSSRDWNNRILVTKVAEQVRSTIQSMVDDSLQQRRSAFFG